jgi:hypothetical protein
MSAFGATTALVANTVILTANWTLTDFGNSRPGLDYSVLPTTSFVEGTQRVLAFLTASVYDKGVKPR